MTTEANQSKLETQTAGNNTPDTDVENASCWRVTQSQENKVLRGISFGLVVSLLILIIGYSLNSPGQKQTAADDAMWTTETSSQNVCLTRGCVIAAANVIDRLDPSVDPCEDFYDFACGSFVKNVVLPEDKSFITTISTTNDILSLKVRLLVEEELKDTDPPSTKLVKSLYKSCMNIDLIELRGLKPLQRILKHLGGWPVVEGDDWDESNFNLIETIYAMRKFGYSASHLFTFGVTTDMKNSSWRIIEFEQAKLGMPSREYFMKGFLDNDVQAYLEYQIRLARLLGADKERAERELAEAVKMEIQIANYTLPEELRRNIELLYNKMTLRELADMLPDIPWLNLTNNFLPPEAQLVTEDEPVIVSVPSFLVHLNELLKVTSKRVISNYLLRYVVTTSASYLSKAMRDAELQYSKKIFGIDREAPRWKDCMDLVSNELPFAVGSLYVRHFFNQGSKTEAEDMVMYIRKAFEDNLQTIDWMDAKTKARAMKKAKATKSLIGYPKELLDEEVLLNHYKGLQVDEKNLLSNVANISIFKSNFMNRLLREKVIKADWKMYGAAAVVNAFYSSVDNAILFPAGILQGIFFDTERPKYMNYGAIGLVIGHEITHGFDDEGSQFNANGDLENWWEMETRKEFLNRSQCIIEQYENFYVPEVQLNLNGIRTQGENIADNGGIKEAYRAYEIWMADHDNYEEPTLPGLDYSPRQMLWISAANLWCSKLRDEYLKMSVLSKFHSPPRFRINGPMRNLEQFAKDWKCSSDTKMNPPKKCSVW